VNIQSYESQGLNRSATIETWFGQGPADYKIVSLHHFAASVRRDAKEGPLKVRFCAGRRIPLVSGGYLSFMTSSFILSAVREYDDQRCTILFDTKPPTGAKPPLQNAEAVFCRYLL